MDRTAIFVTLGCRLNAADEALLTDRLRRNGYRIVAPETAESPALIVLNTCCVTAEAQRKSRQSARKLRARHPGARLVVTGCAAELDPEAWRALADDVLTNAEKPSLDGHSGAPEPGRTHHFLRGGSGETVFRENALSRFPFRSRAFLKIQEGCDNFCTYCIVPRVRGPERSRAAGEVLADCREAIAAGFPELVLTGVNTCAYRDGDRGLAELVREIDAMPGEFRLRLSSTEPHPHNLRLLDALAECPRVCRFLHLSLQHGSDAVLRRMGRRYTAAEFAEFAFEARRRLDGLHLGTDFIVGFPGETDAEFAEALELVHELRFANIHIFPYSPRPGTPAAALPDRVPAEVTAHRAALLRREAEASREAFARSQYGTRRSVIFERIDAAGMLRGWTDNYLAVRVPAGSAPLRKLTRLTLTAENVFINHTQEQP